MIRSTKYIVLALVFPIVVLIGLSIRKKLLVDSGNETTLPIAGYDPRDIFSGHYLRFTVDYGMPLQCKSSDDGRTAYVCIESKNVLVYTPINVQNIYCWKLQIFTI